MTKNNYFNQESFPEHLMNNLVYAIMDEISNKNKEGIEPYEFYANKLHLKLFERPDAISERLTEGYQSLLTELANSQKSNHEK